jgi:hypothetical protein
MNSPNLDLVLKDIVFVLCKTEDHYTRLFELRERDNKTENEMLEEDVLLLNYDFINCRRLLNFPDKWKGFFN